MRAPVYRRLRDLREDKDLKQINIAKYLKVATSTYGSYEIGHRGIPSEVWSQLADFHNTSVDYLMERTDEKEPYPPKRKPKPPSPST